MKKVKFNKKKEYLQDLTGKSILCFTCNRCGPWCAWFDIKEIVGWVPVPTTLGILKTGKMITCKGTPIGELVEDEKE